MRISISKNDRISFKIFWLNNEIMVHHKILKKEGDWDTIFHISDIHIRLFSRREEYEHVFQNLYTCLSAHPKKDSALTVITGDILHNKADLTPECILMTLEFLKNLGQITPTLMIAGNHDALLNNRDRVDSLTGILVDRTPENVFYLKDTGFYRFGKLLFGVNSLLDDEPWIVPPVVVEKQHEDVFTGIHKLIALYHGQVYGWKNNFGFTSETGDRSPTDFSGYDLVLLGDIHKHQYMDAQKTMAYSGSLVSQNFGETDLDHGVLIWDIPSGASHLVRMENPYAFRSGVLSENFLLLEGSPNKIAWREPKTLASVIPTYSNLKVKLQTEKLETHHEFMKSFKSECPLAKLQYESSLSSFSTSSSSSSTPNEGEGVSLYDIQDTLWIRTFVLQRLEGNPLPLIEKIIEELMTQFRKNVQLGRYENPCWELLEVSFDNMFGYGEGNKLDFRTLNRNTVTGIFGKNSFGKSTLIDILTFLLFGKITRGSHGNSTPKEIIHAKEKSCKGEIHFRVGSQEYKISKVCTRQKNNKIKIQETLSLWNGQEWTNYSEEHRKKTDKVIHSILGGYDSFLFTNVSLQQREKSFRDMTQKDRKEFLYSLFGLDWYDTYRKTQEDQLKMLKGEERVYKEKIGDDFLSQWEQKLKSQKTSVATIQSNLQILCDEAIKIDQERESLMGERRACSLSDKKEFYFPMKKAEMEGKILHLSKQELGLQEEKKNILSFQENHPLHDLEREKLSITRDLERLYQNAEILKREEPLYKKWTLASFEDWQSFREKYRMVLRDGCSITNQWMEAKCELEKENSRLEGEQLALKFDTNLVVSENEWETLSTKIPKILLDIPILESRIKEPLVEIPEGVETKVYELSKLVQEYKLLECNTQLLRQNYKENTQIVYNRECEACMNNPFYKSQNELSHKLSDSEYKSNCALAAAKVKVEELKVLWDRIPEEGDIEDISEGLELWVEQHQAQRVESLKKKEQWKKKLESCLLSQQRFEHTKKKRSFLQNKQTMKQIQTKLLDHPFLKAFENLQEHQKHQEAYADLEAYWENREKGAPPLNELKSREKRLDHWIKEAIEKEKRISVLNEELLETNRSRMMTEMELENLEKEGKILEKNQELEEKITEKNGERQKNQTRQESLQKSLHAEEMILEEMKLSKKNWEKNMEKWKGVQSEMNYLRLLLDCIDRDGLPLFLLKMFLPVLQNEVNLLLQSFLEKKLVLGVVENDIVVGLDQKNENISNYMGGMESFIVDLSLKLVFSKFSRLPRSNFIIIDEGISVFDQERISNISVLFNFLSSITDHVFLISHLPTIKDFVAQSIEIVKDENQKSLLCCQF